MKIPHSAPLLILIIINFYFYSDAQEGIPVGTVMFYNLENFFDTEDDSLKQDNEFLPNGDRRWSNYRFYTKMTRISKVISNTGNWEPPILIGLCEVENRKVLEKLVSYAPLKSWNFQIIHKDSPDERGIDVAAIYRPAVFTPVTYRYFPPVPIGDPPPFTREILYVSGIVGETDTIHIFFNHWPSRYSGLMETRTQRQQAAMRLKYEIEILQKKHKNPSIVVMGDFNDQPEDESLLKFLKAEKDTTGLPGHLVNLSFRWMKEGKGTLKFQTQWDIFDQIIVSESLLHTGSMLYSLPDDARILDAPFLLEPDEKHTGMKLNRTYEGFSYHGGYSDHLPVLLMLRKKN
jgi:hypothetical protein